jgi:hypothetical protein
MFGMPIDAAHRTALQPFSLARSCPANATSEKRGEKIRDFALDACFPPRYGPFLDRFRSVLTFRPRVDCDHGRYLAPFKYHFDGAGAGYMVTYNWVLHTAALMNLTIVHVPFKASHLGTIGLDDDATREREFELFEWHANAAEYDACPPDSNVKKNVINVDTLHRIAWPGDAAYKMIHHFIRTHTDPVTGRVEGFSVFPTRISRLVMPYNEFDLGSVRVTSVVNEIRARFRRRDAIATIFYPPVSPTLGAPWVAPTGGVPSGPRRERANTIEVGIHIRRGDLEDHLDLKFYRDRYQSNENYQEMIRYAFRVLPPSTLKRLAVTIYSEGDPKKFKPIVQTLHRYSLAAVRVHTGLMFEALTLLEESDVVFTSFSSFSDIVTQWHADALFLGPATQGPIRHHIFFIQTEAEDDRWRMMTKWNNFNATAWREEMKGLLARRALAREDESVWLEDVRDALMPSTKQCHQTHHWETKVCEFV